MIHEMISGFVVLFLAFMKVMCVVWFTVMFFISTGALWCAIKDKSSETIPLYGIWNILTVIAILFYVWWQSQN